MTYQVGQQVEWQRDNLMKNGRGVIEYVGSSWLRVRLDGIRGCNGVRTVAMGNATILERRKLE